MSTKITLDHDKAYAYHLYQDMMDEGHVHLSLKGIKFKCTQEEIDISIPFEIWNRMIKAKLKNIDPIDMDQALKNLFLVEHK